MIPSPRSSRLRQCLALPAALFAAGLFALIPARSAETPPGSITGSVADASTKAYLEGVRVTLTEVGRSTLTERDGTFDFANVADGTYTLTTFYTGLADSATSVQVSGGKAAPLLLELTPSVYKLDNFVVTASRAGESAAITKQRNTPNVMNVVSTDAFGNVADGNIGNFLVRLPGISSNMENGEVTGIQVRGLPPHLNSVNVDGVRAASAQAGSNSMSDRAAQVDQIPAEFIKEIELNKAPLPEHPADSLGGIVNLVTKSALDYDHDVLTYRVGVNHNPHRADQPQLTPNFALSYLTRLGEQKNIGIALSLTYTDSVSPRDRVDMQRIEADGRNTQARTLANKSQRVRKGAGFKFDYRIDPQTEVYAKFQYNYFYVKRPRTEFSATPTGNRLVADYSVVSRAQIEAGAIPRTTTGAAAGVAPGFTESYTEILNAGWRDAVTGTETLNSQYLTEIGGTRKFAGDQKLSFQATYNPSKSKGTGEGFTTTFTRPIGMVIDTQKDPTKPIYRQTYGPTIAYGSDMSLYTGVYDAIIDNATDDFSNLKADYEKKFTGMTFPLQLKSGLNWRQQRRLGGGSGRSEKWSFRGADGVAGLNRVTGLNDDNLAQFVNLEPAYPVTVQGSTPWPEMNDINLAAVRTAFAAHPSWFVSTSPELPITNDITERVGSAYVQSSVQIRTLNIIGGVRFEKTDLEAKGRNTDPRDPASTLLTKEASYSDYFPSLHFRYEPRPGWIGRASFSTGMARPSMTDLYPTTTVSYVGDYGSVTQNNPGLKPQRSDNFDLSLEYYFEPAGVISVGWFHKNIKDFISRTVTDIGTGPNNGFDGKYEFFSLTSSTNLGSAELDGLEVNYIQNFTMLPKPFNGLGVFANYTTIKTSGTYENGVSELEGFVPKSGNAGVSYRWKELQTRVSLNYTGDYLRTRNDSINQQLRYRAKTTIDISLQYQYRPQLSFFVDFVNITDAWPVWYTGTDRNRVRIADSYGARVNAGVSGRF